MPNLQNLDKTILLADRIGDGERRDDKDPVAIERLAAFERSCGQLTIDDPRRLHDIVSTCRCEPNLGQFLLRGRMPGYGISHLSFLGLRCVSIPRLSSVRSRPKAFVHSIDCDQNEQQLEHTPPPTCARQERSNLALLHANHGFQLIRGDSPMIFPRTNQ